MKRTVRDIVTASLKKLGVIAAGETPAAHEITDGLAALQNMLDSWSNNDLIPWSETTERFQLTPEKQEYSIGPEGDFDTSRPMDILGISVVESGDLELTLGKLKFDQWRTLSIKTTRSTFPTEFYFETSWPLAKLFFYPVPTEAKDIIIYSNKPLFNPTSINDELDLPPGYMDAIIYNLAVALADEFGVALPATIAALAEDRLREIKAQNLVNNIPFAKAAPEFTGSLKRGGWLLSDFLKGGG